MPRNRLTPLVAIAVLAFTGDASAQEPVPVNARAELRVDGPSSFNRFAEAGHAALDFDGDGSDDVAVATPFDSNAGTVHVVFGGATGTLDASALALPAGIQIQGEPGSAKLGLALDAAGDFNGDGLDDLVIGAPGFGGDPECDRGSAYVLFGSLTPSDVDLSSLDPSDGIEISASSDRLIGARVAGGGDINDDGFGDVIAATDRCGAGDEGAAYVVFGSSDPSDVDVNEGGGGFRIRPEEDGAFQAVAMPGDLDLDGADDLALAQVGENRVFVLRGAQPPGNVQLPALFDSQGFEVSGLTVPRELEPAGDSNGDGEDDLAIVDSSGVSVLYGSSDTSDVSDLSAAGGRGFELAIAETATSVAGGDLNGDGYADQVVGLARADRPGVSDAGAAIIVDGGSQGRDLTIGRRSPFVAIRYGGAVGGHALGQTSVVGDFDGDGLGDLSLGAPGTDFNNRLGSGSVYEVGNVPACPNKAVSGGAGSSGNDSYTGSGVADVYAAGDGDDVIALDGARDCAFGGDNQDRITGGTGVDTIFGGEGDDRINGGAAADDLRGGDGIDRIVAVDGVRDRVDCGPGFDIVRADRRDLVRGCERTRRVV